MTDIANQIKKVRELKNFSQDFVAKKLGMSQGNYARLENGGIKISKERLKQISDILETSENSIHNFDEKLFYSMNKANYQPNPDLIPHFFEGLIKLYKDEIEFLQRKINLLESLSEH